MTGTNKTQFSILSEYPPQPTIILVNPQMGENIGAAARAMLNCGLSHLRLVNPRDGWPSERAEATSSGALALMPEVQVFKTLPEAVADCNTVFATTARARDLVKPVYTPRAAAHSIREKINATERVAILFGAERAGLTNEELEQAHHLITIPLNPGFSSLNLAQSVLLVAYEWSQYVFEAPSVNLPTGKSLPAKTDEFNMFFNRLDDELQKNGFYRVPEMKDLISRNIRSLFSRAQPTDQEISTLHGILSALLGHR